MQLIHRTNYWGKWIQSNDNDKDVDFDAIWMQAMADYNGDCCRGFGKRRVHVTNDDFINESDGWWSLFLVNASRGDNDEHYFLKFVAIPQDTYGYGKKGCKRRGWIYKGEFLASQAIGKLEQLLDHWLNMDDDDINHIHIGACMDGLSAP